MFIAHIRENNDEIFEEQSVQEHCSAAAELAKEFGAVCKMKYLAELAGKLHDIGKLSREFNDYIHGEVNAARGSIEHAFAGARFIFEYAKTRSDVPMAENTAALIGRVIISHHGIHDWLKEDGANYFSKKIGVCQNYDEILSNICEVIAPEELDELFEKSAEEYAAIYNKVKELSDGDKVRLTFYLGMVERLLQSQLIDADRINTAEFMDGKRLRLSYDVQNVWNGMAENISQKNIKFKKLTGRISLLRMDISDRCAAFAEKKRGICRLSVPVGGGKTISSLRFAVEQCKRFGMERIIYVAPYMSIIEQNSDEIRYIVGDDSLFLEHHSNIVSKLDDDTEGSDEKLKEYELRTDLWDSPVIATTFVQFLNTLFLSKKTSVRRMHRLANSVIIIDEVQAVPIKCIALFDLAVNFLSRFCGSTVVLCTATQPTLDDVKYGISFDDEESMTGNLTEDFKAFERTKLVSAIRKQKYSLDEAADFCAEKFSENGNVLMIVNTKHAAAEIFQRLGEMKLEYNGEQAELVHLSTNMCAAHREDAINRVKSLLNIEKPVICVTTQLIEAGVDISFNCVIRSLAGLDSAAQAAGRCNRHGDSSIKPVYIINIDPKDEKSGSIREIKQGAIITNQLALVAPQRLSDIDVMKAYFKRYYSAFAKELTYKAKDGSAASDLLDMLSLDSIRRPFCKKLDYKDQWQAFQAFASAGRSFKVIDESTVAVIVPYNDEAVKIISALSKDNSIGEEIKLLRKAQRYTVSCRKTFFSKLCESNSITELNGKGIYTTFNKCYDTSLGLIVHGEAELLCF